MKDTWYEQQVDLNEAFPHDKARWRQTLHHVIFGVDTRAGRLFDVVLLWAITLSIVCVVLESVETIRAVYGGWLRAAEWFFTGLFFVEYVLRIVSTNKPLRYATSFFGIVDLFSILPTPMSLFFESAQSLLVLRAVRLLRVFRILKLFHFVGEADVLMKALGASRRKITVFVGAVLAIALIVGALMYVVEGAEAGFTSIPIGVYWAVVTMTTVGYGDIVPMTPFGKLAASTLMILGYGIIAIPTGIVTVEMGRVHASAGGRACPACQFVNQASGAKFCAGCAQML